MKQDTQQSINLKLKNIPEGFYQIQEYQIPTHQEKGHFERLPKGICGKGLIEKYEVFPGVELAYQWFLGEQIHFHHDALHSSLEINHCHLGRIGIDMKEHKRIFLGEGDMALQPMDYCADAAISLPLGYYEGIMITLNLEELTTNPPALLAPYCTPGEILTEKFCGRGVAVAVAANHRTQHIFCELYQVPREYKLPYIQLKTQELILFLCLLQRSEETRLNAYVSDQIEIIKLIHEKLTSRPALRFTIEELSAEFLINPTTLKTTFKNIYGLPIASYMKKYRMEAAAARLKETGDSIALIAADVGYGSQGKFTKAFKEQTGMSPSEYRRQYM